MRLSVAICTHNPDESLLERTLDSIVDQLAGSPDTELLVVDNNSSESVALNPRFGRFSEVRWLSEPKPGLTAARAKVIAEATGEVITFVDDDNLLDAGYLNLVRENFTDDPKLGLLGGAVIPDYVEPPPKWLHRFEESLAIRRYRADFKATVAEKAWSPLFPIGAGMSMRADLARDYVAHCEASEAIEGRRGGELSSGEDLDMGLYSLSRSLHLKVDGRLRLTHVIPPTRTEIEYMVELTRGAVRSSWLVECKWRPILDRPIFPMFHLPAAQLYPRVAIARVMAPFSSSFRIKNAVYEEVVKARLNRSARG